MDRRLFEHTEGKTVQNIQHPIRSRTETKTFHKVSKSLPECTHAVVQIDIQGSGTKVSNEEEKEMAPRMPVWPNQVQDPSPEVEGLS